MMEVQQCVWSVVLVIDLAEVEVSVIDQIDCTVFLDKAKAEERCNFLNKQLDSITRMENDLGPDDSLDDHGDFRYGNYILAVAPAWVVHPMTLEG